METQREVANGGPQGNHPPPGPVVPITIDNEPREIHRGRQSVTEIKKVGKVPQAFELSELINNKLTPLPDDGAVTIKGGEVFLSNPRSSGSS